MNSPPDVCDLSVARSLGPLMEEANREDPGSNKLYPRAWSLLPWPTQTPNFSFREIIDVQLTPLCSCSPP